MRPMLWFWVNAIALPLDYTRCNTQNCWCSVDALLTLCWRSVDALLTLCWRSIDALLTLCWHFVDALLMLIFRCSDIAINDIASVNNGSAFRPGRFYRSAWEWPNPIKNRRFFNRTITLRPQILISEFSVWYVSYAALHGTSFGHLRFLISSNLSKR